MRNWILGSTAFAALFAAGLAVVPVQAGETDGAPAIPYYFFCRANGDVAKVFYFSKTQQAAAGVGRQDLQKSFRAFLVQKYKYPATGSVSCVYAVGGDLQARTESTRQQTIDNLHAANYEVVDPGWTYTK